MAFGGRIHMRHLLEAYFAMVDPIRNTPENVNITIEYVIQNGALALLRELNERYKVPLKLSVQEIQGQQHEINLDQAAAKKLDLGAARPAVMSLMRGAAQPINPPAAAPVPVNNNKMRPLSAALSVASSKGPAAWSVSEDAEIRGLIEIFYAKNNPEKLSNGGVDALMKYARVNGLESVNVKLMEKYGEDLDTLKVQYSSLMQTLQKYYAKADPSKTNVEDIAAWAIVHGTQPLSDRLEKRYGKGLFAEDEQPMDATTLRQRLVLFYQTFDKQPKSDSDLETIVSWVMAGSVTQLNKKLKEKYGSDLNDLPPLEVGERVEIPIPRTMGNTAPKPEALGTGAPPPPRKPSVAAQSAPPQLQKKKETTPPGTPPRSASPADALRDRSDSFASAAGDDSMDRVEQQMTNMRRITSGQYENLGLLLRAFYRRVDPEKLENREAMDLIIKWTFKHGMKALNDKFRKHYGKTLEGLQIDDQDAEAEEADDYVPEW
jgi:hypothetical protein